MAEVTAQELYNWILKNWSKKIALIKVDVLPDTGLYNTMYLAGDGTFHYWDGSMFIAIGGGIDAVIFADRHQAVNSIEERNAITLENRSIGKLVTYRTEELVPVTGRFDGSEVVDDQWTNDNNWTLINGEGSGAEIQIGTYAGKFDASTQVMPFGNAGDFWVVSVAGDITGLVPIHGLQPGDIIQATVDAAENVEDYVSFRGYGTYTQIAAELQAKADKTDPRFPSSDEKAALNGANTPSGSNPMVTMNDLPVQRLHGYVGTFDPTSGLPVSGTGVSSAIKKGNYYKAIKNANISGLGAIYEKDYLLALKDNPGTTTTNWSLMKGSNQSESVSNIIYIDKIVGDNANGGRTKITPVKTITEAIVKCEALRQGNETWTLYFLNDYTWETDDIIPVNTDVVMAPGFVLTIGTNLVANNVVFNGANTLTVAEAHLKKTIITFNNNDLEFNQSRIDIGTVKVYDTCQVLDGSTFDTSTFLVDIKQLLELNDTATPACTFRIIGGYTEFYIPTSERRDQVPLISCTGGTVRWSLTKTELQTVAVNSALIELDGNAIAYINAEYINTSRFAKINSTDVKLYAYIAEKLQAVELYTADSISADNIFIQTPDFYGFELPVATFQTLASKNDILNIDIRGRKIGQTFNIQNSPLFYCFENGVSDENLVEYSLNKLNTTNGVTINYYVNSIAGDDVNEGSQELPFKTLEYALNKIKDLSYSTINIYLATGDYIVTDPVVIDGKGNLINIIGQSLDTIKTGLTLTQDNTDKHKYTVAGDTFLNDELMGCFLYDYSQVTLHPISKNTESVIFSTADAGTSTRVLKPTANITYPNGKDIIATDNISTKVVLSKVNIGIPDTLKSSNQYQTQVEHSVITLPSKDVGIDFKYGSYTFDKSVINYNYDNPTGIALKVHSINPQIKEMLHNTVIYAPVLRDNQEMFAVGSGATLFLGNLIGRNFTNGIDLLDQTSKVVFTEKATNLDYQNITNLHKVNTGGNISMTPGIGSIIQLTGVDSYLTGNGGNTNLTVVLPSDLVINGTFNIKAFSGIDGYYIPNKNVLITAPFIPDTVYKISKLISDGETTPVELGSSTLMIEAIINYHIVRNGKQESGKYVLLVQAADVTSFEVFRAYDKTKDVQVDLSFRVTDGKLFMDVASDPIAENFTFIADITRKLNI